MTPQESYKNYYRFCRDTETWTWDFIRHNLKETGIDYEEYNFEEFKDKVLTDENFNQRWGNGCKEELERNKKIYK